MIVLVKYTVARYDDPVEEIFISIQEAENRINELVKVHTCNRDFKIIRVIKGEFLRLNPLQTTIRYELIP